MPSPTEAEWGAVDRAKQFLAENHHSNRKGPPPQGYAQLAGEAIAEVMILLAFIERNMER